MTAENPKYFFSYAHDDSEFVLALAEGLRTAGANLWLDRLDILGGQHWDESIQKALESCPGMLVVLSPSAVASQNCLDEISYAVDERKRIIPVLYRPCAIPFRLRRMHHIDFTTNRERGFEELLRSLGLGHREKGEDATELEFTERELGAAEHDEKPDPVHVPVFKDGGKDEHESGLLHSWVVRIVILLAIAIIGYLLISVVIQGSAG